MGTAYSSKKLLDPFPVMRSSDHSEIEHVVLGIYGARRFDLINRTERVRLYANCWRSEALVLSIGQLNGATVDIQHSEASFFRQHFVLSGSMSLRVGAFECAMSPFDTLLVPAGRTLGHRLSPGTENLAIRFAGDYLSSKIVAICGEASALRHADARKRSDPSGAARLERLIRFFSHELEQASPLSPPFLAEMEQALAIAFLAANPQLSQPGQPRAPHRPSYRQLCCAEEYIEAHWADALTLESLAAATHVSTRSLFHYFRKWRGKTPMQYLKEVRLDHARELLRRSPALSVAEVAFSCGFGNQGHFAHDYQKRWGERPSETRTAFKYLSRPRFSGRSDDEPRAILRNRMPSR